MTNRKFLHICLAAIAAATAASRGYGSSVSAEAICSQDNLTTDDHVSTTAGVGASATLDHCSASAFADWSVLRVGGSTNLLQQVSPNSQQSNSQAQWTIFFSLTDPNLPSTYGRQFNLLINYDVTLSANAAGFGGVESVASFAVTVNNDPFTHPVQFATGFDSNANNTCPSPLQSIPRCNGHYTGTGVYPVTFYYNAPFLNRIILAVNAQTLDAVVDATHSVSLGQILLDNTTTFAYDDPNIGNPAGFTYAQVGGVPEPSSVMLAIAGVAAVGLRRVVRRRSE